LDETRSTKEGMYLILGHYNNELLLHKRDTIFCYANEKITCKINVPFNNDTEFDFRLVSAKYKNGVFYIHQGKIFYFDFESKNIRAYNFFLKGILEFKIFDNQIIITFNNGGLRFFNINENLDLEPSAKTNSDVIFTDIFKDKDHNYWIGTNTNGVIFFPKASNQITSRKKLNNVRLNALNCMYLDGDSLWLGTKKGDVILVHNSKASIKTIPIKNPNGETRIIDIEKFDNNKLIISTDAGMFILDKDDELKFIFRAAFKAISVVDNDIYFNCHFGILKSDKDCLNSISSNWTNGNDHPKQLGLIGQTDEYCRKIVFNNRSHLTQFINSKNVFVYEPDTGLVKYSLTNDKLANREIIKESIDVNDLFYFNNSLFIATTGEGLLTYNTQTKEIKPFNSISSSTIYCLDVDTTTKKMYASSNQGIHLINLNDDGLEDYQVLNLNGLKSIMLVCLCLVIIIFPQIVIILL